MATSELVRADFNHSPVENDKSIYWRNDNESPSPSSSSSIIGEDIHSTPPFRFASASVTSTTIFLAEHVQHSNGHKKLNRSQSEPRGRFNRNTGGNSSSRYKTELCHPFEENGICKYGEKCQFAHGIEELRDLARHPKYKTELCRTFHAEGYCPYGSRCHFIHEERNLIMSQPAALCLYPTMSVSSVKDLSLSPNSLNSLSPASSINAFSYTTSSMCSPPPSPIEGRLPIFNEISAPGTLLPFCRQFNEVNAPGALLPFCRQFQSSLKSITKISNPLPEYI